MDPAVYLMAPFLNTTHSILLSGRGAEICLYQEKLHVHIHVHVHVTRRAHPGGGAVPGASFAASFFMNCLR